MRINEWEIQQCIRKTLEFIGDWKQIHNSNFKGLEFETFRNPAETEQLYAWNPNGIPSPSPRLRGTSYLGRSSNKKQPQRGCVNSCDELGSCGKMKPNLMNATCGIELSDRTPAMATTPLGLRGFFGPVAQGGSCLATLGFVAQSLWDCAVLTTDFQTGAAAPLAAKGERA
jgi:hypothetical protein